MYLISGDINIHRGTVVQLFDALISGTVFEDEARLGPHLQTIMKNLMRSRGCGVLPLSSAERERCSALCHSWVLRSTRTSLGSSGTSELQSSNLGDWRGGFRKAVGKKPKGHSLQHRAASHRHSSWCCRCSTITVTTHLRGSSDCTSMSLSKDATKASSHCCR